ncbi:MAG: HupA family protein, partial [Planctomycetota bacterium]
GVIDTDFDTGFYLAGVRGWDPNATPDAGKTWGTAGALQPVAIETAGAESFLFSNVEFTDGEVTSATGHIVIETNPFRTSYNSAEANGTENILIDAPMGGVTGGGYHGFTHTQSGGDTVLIEGVEVPIITHVLAGNRGEFAMGILEGFSPDDGYSGTSPNITLNGDVYNDFEYQATFLAGIRSKTLIDADPDDALVGLPTAGIRIYGADQYEIEHDLAPAGHYQFVEALADGSGQIIPNGSRMTTAIDYGTGKVLTVLWADSHHHDGDPMDIGEKEMLYPYAVFFGTTDANGNINLPNTFQLVPGLELGDDMDDGLGRLSVSGSLVGALYGSEFQGLGLKGYGTMAGLGTTPNTNWAMAGGAFWNQGADADAQALRDYEVNMWGQSAYTGFWAAEEAPALIPDVGSGLSINVNRANSTVSASIADLGLTFNANSLYVASNFWVTSGSGGYMMGMDPVFPNGHSAAPYLMMGHWQADGGQDYRTDSSTFVAGVEAAGYAAGGPLDGAVYRGFAINTKAGIDDRDSSYLWRDGAQGAEATVLFHDESGTMKYRGDILTEGGFIFFNGDAADLTVASGTSANFVSSQSFPDPYPIADLYGAFFQGPTGADPYLAGTYRREEHYSNVYEVGTFATQRTDDIYAYGQFHGAWTSFLKDNGDPNWDAAFQTDMTAVSRNNELLGRPMSGAFGWVHSQNAVPVDRATVYDGTVINRSTGGHEYEMFYSVPVGDMNQGEAMAFWDSEPPLATLQQTYDHTGQFVLMELLHNSTSSLNAVADGGLVTHTFAGWEYQSFGFAGERSDIAPTSAVDDILVYGGTLQTGRYQTNVTEYNFMDDWKNTQGILSERGEFRIYVNTVNGKSLGYTRGLQTRYFVGSRLDAWNPNTSQYEDHGSFSLYQPGTIRLNDDETAYIHDGGDMMTTADFFGDQFQGIGLEARAKAETILTDAGSRVDEETVTVTAGAFRNPDESAATGTAPTGSRTLKGFVVGTDINVSDPANPSPRIVKNTPMTALPGAGQEGVVLDVNLTNGTVSGTIRATEDTGANTTVNLTLPSTAPNTVAVLPDVFFAEIDSNPGPSAVDTDAGFSSPSALVAPVANEQSMPNYLVTAPKELQADWDLGQEMVVWGEWGAVYSDGGNRAILADHSYWVAGKEVTSAVVGSFSGSASYTGPAFGTFTSAAGVIDNLYQANGTNLNVNFGTQTIQGQIDLVNHQLVMPSTNYNANGIFNSGSATWNMNGSAVSGATTHIQGSLYGQDAVDATKAAGVGGTFSATGTPGSLVGGFVGKKQ